LEYSIGNELVNARIIVGILFLSDERAFLSMIRIVMASICTHVTVDTRRQLNKRGTNQKAVIEQFYSMVFQLIILSFDSPCNGSHPFWSLALSVVGWCSVYYYLCRLYILFALEILYAGYQTVIVCILQIK